MDWPRISVLSTSSISLLFASVALDQALAHPTPVDFDGRILRWDIGSSEDVITWAVEVESGKDLKLYNYAVERAADLWSNIPTSYLKLSAATSEQTPRITIHFDESIPGGETSAGYAQFDEFSGTTPDHCSIHIAAVQSHDWQNTSKTILHELGHCLGLGHSLVPESIMSYALDKNGFYLALDDRAAITRLYPLDQSEPKLPPGCAIGASQKARLSSGWWICLTLIPLLIRAFCQRHLFGLASRR